MRSTGPVLAVTMGGDATTTVVSVDVTGAVARWLAGAAAPVGVVSGGPVAAASVAATEDAVIVLWRDGQGRPRVEILSGGTASRPAILAAPAPVEALALSPSGSLAVLACSDGRLRALEVATGRVTWAALTPTANAVGLAVARDAGSVVVAFADGSVQRYDRETDTWLVVHRGEPARAVAITPDGRSILFADVRGTVSRCDAVSGSARAVVTVGEEVSALAVDAAGDRVVVASGDGQVQVHDLAGGEPVIDQDVRFTVYRPKVVQPGRWASLLVFAHKTDLVEDPERGLVDPTETVQGLARAHFGEEPAQPVAEDAQLALALGSRLRIVPNLPGVRCNPPYAELEWLEPVHETQFRLLAGPELAGTRVRGAVRVWCGALIVAEVSISLAVATPQAKPTESAPAVDPLTRYRRIFPSYSHADREIVASFASAARALGDQFLQDVLTLRAGEQWSPRLIELIDSADVFQLFWSSNSMRSPHCREEWEHALSLHRPLFIRPVYWEDPLPAAPQLDLPPDGLRALHFVKVPIARPPGPAHASVVCPVCGQQNARTETFCVSCGTFLQWSAHAPRPSGSTPAPTPPVPAPHAPAPAAPSPAPRVQPPPAPVSEPEARNFDVRASPQEASPAPRSARVALTAVALVVVLVLGALLAAWLVTR